jgi:polyisoprenoid-binding protein YceI
MSTQITTVPGYVVGTWAIDPVHSEASFVVRHLGVAKVRGRFDMFEGQIVTAENLLESSVTATIDATSVSTGNTDRDQHVRAEDFLDVANHPTITFTSTGVRTEGEQGFLEGELTIRGVTKPVTLAIEINGFGEGFEGKPVIGVSATAEIKRTDFGVTAGPVSAMVSDKVKISLEIEANKTD